ncbi:MAG: hypothetical protein ACR2OR_05625 [Hyphomicrobiales bacterium]
MNYTVGPLRKFLLSSAALIMGAAQAQAEDLAGLKAQIEAMQNQVSQLELKSGTVAEARQSGISVMRGNALADWNTDSAGDVRIPDSRGVTIAITPTTDMPAPVTEVSISGYVKTDFIWDFDQDLGPSFNTEGIDQRAQKDVSFHTHAFQSRFRIQSRTDTSIGEIRTLLEGDFYGDTSTDGLFRLRHAWGEWDFMPHWTLAIGRFWRVGVDLLSSVTLVDFDANSYVGSPSKTRTEQIRLQYVSGPLTFAFGVQGPQTSNGADNTVAACSSELGLQTVRETGCQITVGTTETAIAIPIGANPTAFTRQLTNAPNLPSFGAHMLYETEFEHGFFIGGELQQNNIDRNAEGWVGSGTDNAIYGNSSKLGWVASVGANINVTDFLELKGHLSVSEGLVSRIGGAGGDIWGQETVVVEEDGTHVTKMRVVESKAWGGYVGAHFDATEHVSFNARYGFVDPADRAMTGGGIQWSHLHEIHANVMWRPVHQMRLGLEFIYGRKTNGKNFVKGYNFGTENKGDPHNINGGGQCEDEKANALCRKRHEDAFRAHFGAWFFF